MTEDKTTYLCPSCGRVHTDSQMEPFWCETDVCNACARWLKKNAWARCIEEAYAEVTRRQKAEVELWQKAVLDAVEKGMGITEFRAEVDKLTKGIGHDENS